MGWLEGGEEFGERISQSFISTDHIDVLHIHTIHFYLQIFCLVKNLETYIYISVKTMPQKKLLLLRTAKASLQFQFIKTSWLRKTNAAKGNVSWIFFNVGMEFIALCGSGYLLKNVHLWIS